jgi:hypothetical protein
MDSAGVNPFWIPAFAGMTGRDRNDKKGREQQNKKNEQK